MNSLHKQHTHPQLIAARPPIMLSSGGHVSTIVAPPPSVTLPPIPQSSVHSVPPTQNNLGQSQMASSTTTAPGVAQSMTTTSSSAAAAAGGAGVNGQNMNASATPPSSALLNNFKDTFGTTKIGKWWKRTMWSCTLLASTSHSPTPSNPHLLIVVGYANQSYLHLIYFLSLFIPGPPLCLFAVPVTTHHCVRHPLTCPFVTHYGVRRVARRRCWTVVKQKHKNI